MDMPHVSATVNRITIFDRDAAGNLQPVTIYKRRRSKKKQSRGLKPLERAVRMLADANDRVAGSYTSRHRRSNRKKRDGWMKDLPINLSKAANKGRKEIKLRRLLSW
jgi:hypothetical protein